MFRLYSKGCEYAIRALMVVAPTDSEKRFQAKKVCKKARIPESFTRKIFQDLVAAGFLEAVRGPGGGYSLVYSPAEISLLEIIEAVDGKDTFDHCIMGLPACQSTKPCPLHETWSKAKQELVERLESKTLEDLIEASKARSTMRRAARRKRR